MYFFKETQGVCRAWWIYLWISKWQFGG